MDDLPPADGGLPLDSGIEPQALGEAVEAEPLDTTLVEPTDQALEDAFETQEPAMIEAVDHDVEVYGFADSGLWNDQDVEGFVEDNIPPEHLTNLDNITYDGSDQAREEGVLGEWSEDLSDRNHICVYPHDDADEMRWTVAHEVGHNAQDAVVGWDSDLAREWTDLHEQSQECVSAYAETGPEEDFAECYSAYINDPPLLSKVNPEKYDFLCDHVFNGREYWAR